MDYLYRVLIRINKAHRLTWGTEEIYPNRFEQEICDVTDGLVIKYGCKMKDGTIVKKPSVWFRQIEVLLTEEEIKDVFSAIEARQDEIKKEVLEGL